MSNGYTMHDVRRRLMHADQTANLSPWAHIGTMAEWRNRTSKHQAIIGAHATIREEARVHAGVERNTIVGDHTLIMSGAHVGHDVQIGNNTDIAANTVLGGCSTIGSNVKIGMGAVVNPHITIGDNVRIGSGSVVTKNVPPGEVWAGNPARYMRDRDQIGKG